MQFVAGLTRSTPMEYRIPQYVTVVEKTAPRQDVCRVVVHCGVKAIAEDAFRDWTSLADVAFELGSQLETVGAHAFMGTALERIKKGTDIQREVGCWRCGCGTIEDTGKAAAGRCTEGNNVK